MRYHYTISHVVSKELFTADTLSTVPIHVTDRQSNQFQQEVSPYVNLNIDHLPALHTKFEEIKKAQEQDPVCQQLKSYCQMGWPAKSPYAAVMHEVTVTKDLLLRDHHSVVPFEMRRDVIEKLHAGHQGIIKCRRRAQQSVWWSGLGKDVKEKTSNCTTCCQHQSLQVEPMI